MLDLAITETLEREAAAREQYLPRRKVRKRYDVSDETVRRWTKSSYLNFPPPRVFNGRHYWALSDLITWEREQGEIAAAQEQ